MNFDPLGKLGWVVRIVVDSLPPHVESGPNDYRKDAPPFEEADHGTGWEINFDPYKIRSRDPLFPSVPDFLSEIPKWIKVIISTGHVTRFGNINQSGSKCSPYKTEIEIVYKLRHKFFIEKNVWARWTDFHLYSSIIFSYTRHQRWIIIR